MAQYRVKSGIYMDGTEWFLPQKKGWIFWHNISLDCKKATYWRTLEQAKEAIEIDKKYSAQKQSIVWEE